MRGWFITLEGPEGCGKSTQLRLLASWLSQAGVEPVVTREPGGTPIGEVIRDLLHDCSRTDMAFETEILLYAASRAQHVVQVIRPELDQGRIVLCDRFYDSTYAYQGYGRGLPLEALRRITAFATQGLVPDLTLYLDVSPEVGLRRRQESGEALNRLDREAVAFHTRVRQGYLALMAEEPERWRCIDATRPIEAVHAALRGVLLDFLPHLKA
jgi:dTMP kinase